MYLLLLVVAWAVVLLPPLIQRLVVARPSTGRDPLAALARRQQANVDHPVTGAGTSEADTYTPRSAADAQQRRRLVAIALGTLALLTLFMVPILGPAMLLLHLTVDAALVGFAYLWWQRNQALDQATASVVALSSLRHAAGARRPTPADPGELGELGRVVNG